MKFQREEKRREIIQISRQITEGTRRRMLPTALNL
jgi:hypothetical protein